MQIHKFKKTIYFLLCTLLVGMASCSKDDNSGSELEPNLATSVSQETKNLQVNEGSFAVFNYNLTKVLSEDLPIRLAVSTKDIELPIDENDYEFEFQFKGDRDAAWITSTSPNIFFPKGNISMKIRFRIIDDQNTEVNELFNFSIDLGESNTDFEIMSVDQLTPILVTIVDNDAVPGEIFTETGIVVAYEIDDDNNYTITKTQSEFIMQYRDKWIFDKLIRDGVPEQIKRDIKIFNDAMEGDGELRRIELGFDDFSGVGGYVEPYNPKENGLKSWTMGLNLNFAYRTLAFLNLSSPEEKFTEAFSDAEYNKDQAFGYIMIHELGHVVTLNQTQIYNLDSPEAKNCQLPLTIEGCPKEDSMVYAFLTDYIDSPNIPHNVSFYATTNPFEDLAETFTWAALQETIPESDDTNSRALQKINFIKNHPAFKGRDYRKKLEGIRADFSVILNGPFGGFNTPIFNYNLKTKKATSCVRNAGSINNK